MGAILRLLSNKGYISYNKQIAKECGINEAVLLGELCSLSDLFDETEIYMNQSKISEDTSLSAFQIREAAENLQSKGIIKIDRKGRPCRNYYTLNEKKLIELLDGKKKKPLLEREPANDLEKIEKVYLINYQRLYESGVVRFEKPVINWTQARKLEKDCIAKYGVEELKKAVKRALDNKFVISGGYNLCTILSAGVLSQLINSTDGRIDNDSLEDLEIPF